MRIYPRGEWPAEELEAVPACPLCSETRRSLLYDGIGDTLRMCAPGRWTLYTCAGCGSAYLDPRPKAEYIGKAYAAFYTHTAPEVYNAVWGGNGNWLSRQLHKDYYNARYGYHLKNALFPGRYIVDRSLLEKAEVDFQMRVRSPFASAKLLDVGCGNGSFLLTAKHLGWDASGIEIDPAAVAMAQKAGLAVQIGTLETVDLAPASFDVITICHVIEHLHDPLKAIQRMFALLKPGGQLWLATPNLEGAGHREFGRDWIHLDPPRHLILFTPDSITKALAQAGFSIVEEKGVPNARFHYPISWAIREGLDPLSPEVWKQAPPAIQEAAQSADLLFSSTPRKSDEYVVIANKPG